MANYVSLEEAAKILGVDGIVTGVLNNDGNVDVDRMKVLIARARPLQGTFTQL